MTEINKDTTLPVRLLKKYGISMRGVARSLGMKDSHTIGRALDPDKFLNSRHKILLQVRHRVELMVRAAGWDGTTKELWAEYSEEPEASSNSRKKAA